MYELVQISEKCYYINCPAKIGIYVADSGKVYLIDSGNDKDAGRKVRQILEQKGWRPAAILNTHSNADHIGGNRYLQGQTGCKVYSGGIEAAFTKFPVLEPSFLYGGYPCKDLRHKFLMAQESEVTDFSDEDFPKEVEVIPLPGHFFDMVGFRIPDGTVFLADCLSSRETLEKYAVSFIYDVGEYLKTLDKVENMEGTVFVPAHAEVTADIGELVRYNRNKVHEVEERILVICREPLCFEKILKEVFRGYGLTMNFEQYVLVGSTVRSYLSWLKDSGKLGIIFQDNMLLWQAV
ncbi:MAG: MBL fold metallo-hydrolase [Lachnoclostridium sp.]|nr:MBL fold metallo-hydrolase [Lachnospira sp.]MCM1249237.1 MBL fold metallo-hydrolase [Lachnoclostridium sp.]